MKANRREQTRLKILESAHEVLVQYGYERATLAEISKRAGVHLQTLVRHFPTKSEMMAAIHLVTLERFDEYFRKREVDALQAWRDWVQIHAEASPEILVFPNDSYRFPITTPEGQEAIHQIRELLAQGIADDLGVNRTFDLRPTLIACMAVGGNTHVAQSWRGKRFVREAFVASLLEVVDLGEEMLRSQYPVEQREARARQQVAVLGNL